MKDVLYITHRVPWPPNRGDRIRTYNILKYLGERCRLHVVTLADEPAVADANSELEKYCQSVRIVRTGRSRWLRAGFQFLTGGTVTEGLFQSREVSKAVTDLCQQHTFEAAIVSSSGLGHYLRLPALQQARKWVDLIDVDSQKWLDYAGTSRFPLSTIYRREGQRLRQVEQRLARECEELTVVTDSEVDVFRSFSPDGRVTAITNGVNLDYFAPPPNYEREAKCVFVGVLNYKPNLDGVVWFCKDVWPSVRRRCPDARFQIVGRNPTPEVTALGSIDGVEVVGPVDDVRPYLWSSAAVVTPLLIARGVQNKVLEAFAAGRPVVSSRNPLVGLEIQPGVHALRADTIDEWTQQLSELFEEPGKGDLLGRAARDWVTAHHRWDVCLKEFDRLIQADKPTATSNPAVLEVEHA